MAPEQFMASYEATGATDIYSLAIVFVEVLTGKKPFSGDSIHDVVLKQLQENTSVDFLIKKGLSRGLAKVFASALVRDPQKRISCSEQFLSELKAIRSDKNAKVTVLTKGMKAQGSPGADKRKKNRWYIPFAMALLLMALYLISFQRSSSSSLSNLSIVQRTDAESAKITFTLSPYRSLPFKVLDDKGKALRNGSSSPVTAREYKMSLRSEGPIKCQIFVDRLLPDRNYTIEIGKTPDQRRVKIGTKKARLLSPPWIFTHGSSLYFDFQSNLRNLPLEIVLHLPEGDKKQSCRKSPAIFEGLIKRDMRAIPWSIFAAKQKVMKGTYWRNDSAFPGTLPWRSHDAPLLEWYKNKLFICDASNGFALLEPATVASDDSHVFNTYWTYLTGEYIHWKVLFVPPLVSEKSISIIGNGNENEIQLWTVNTSKKELNSLKAVKPDEPIFVQGNGNRRGNYYVFTGHYRGKPLWSVLHLGTKKLKTYGADEFQDWLQSPLSGTTDRAINTLGLRPRLRRNHGGLLLHKDNFYSYYTKMMDNPSRVIGCLLARHFSEKDGKLGKTKLIKNMYVTDTRHSVALSPDGHLHLTATSGIFSTRDNGTIYELPKVHRDSTYLAGTPLFTHRGVHCLAFKGTKSHYGQLTLKCHFMTKKTDGRVLLHEPAIFQQISIESRPTTPLLFTLFKERYIVCAVPSVVFAIDLKTGAFGKARFMEVIRRCTISPKGVITLLLGNGRLSFKPITLLIKESKLWLTEL